VNKPPRRLPRLEKRGLFKWVVAVPRGLTEQAHYRQVLNSPEKNRRMMKSACAYAERLALRVLGEHRLPTDPASLKKLHADGLKPAAFMARELALCLSRLPGEVTTDEAEAAKFNSGLALGCFLTRLESQLAFAKPVKRAQRSDASVRKAHRIITPAAYRAAVAKVGRRKKALASELGVSRQGLWNFEQTHPRLSRAK
jgi:hypothetical protein